MRLLKQALALFGALVVLAVIVAFVAPKKAHALGAALVQIVPVTTTHVGQNESQLVALNCGMGNSFCNAVDPQEVVDATTAYVVPTGYTLIVTDYEWTRFISVGAGETVFDALDSISSTPLSFHTLVNSSAVTDSHGVASIHDRFATGIRIGSGVELVDAQALNNTGFAFVQGYLVPND
jgi:hypothetical protein